MKTTIRPQSFETNSSSQHALIWSKTYNMSSSKDIEYVPAGDFWWGYEVYTEPVDRLSYLWTAIGDNNGRDPIAMEAWQERLISVLNLPDDVCFERDDWGVPGSIDHGDECSNLLDALAEDDELLRAFVFGDGVIECGNDNEGWPEDHWIHGDEFDWGWDEENQESIPPRCPWEEVIEYDGKWMYLKGN